jgi:hypothetical protein
MASGVLFEDSEVETNLASEVHDVRGPKRIRKHVGKRELYDNRQKAREHGVCRSISSNATRSQILAGSIVGMPQIPWIFIAAYLKHAISQPLQGYSMSQLGPCLPFASRVARCDVP